MNVSLLKASLPIEALYTMQWKPKNKKTCPSGRKQT